MSGFTLLWSSIVRSSIWVKGTKEERILWITMLALRDSAGKVASSLVGLADAAKLGRKECEVALAALLSPDPDDTSGVEEGRRLRAVPGGWEIINHDLYRFSTEAKREFWRQQKAEQRAREAAELAKLKGGKELPKKPISYSKPIAAPVEQEQPWA